MITIDGSYGEGGGQILRSALSLSLVTGKPFSIENIRANRKKPGLMRQHLTAVNAAAEIGNATVQGNRIGSRSFAFIPETIKPGNYHYAIGSAGSCTLVLQSILPALMVANAPSTVILEGGTHNPFAPPFDFLEKAFLKLLGKMGPKVAVKLEKPGFYPAGGGRFAVSITPVKKLKNLELMERGHILEKTAVAAVSNLSMNIAKRELKAVRKMLGWDLENTKTIEVKNARGPGNILTLEIESENIAEVFTGFGEKGMSAEKVARRAARQARDYVKLDVPVGRYLADQILIPMAMAGKGRFRTVPPSNHTRTNADIIGRFLNVNIDINEINKGLWEIAICSPPASNE